MADKRTKTHYEYLGNDCYMAHFYPTKIKLWMPKSQILEGIKIEDSWRKTLAKILLSDN